MPQMAPLWWTLLLITFLSSFFMIMILMYFQKLNIPFQSESKSQKTNQMNWKW